MSPNGSNKQSLPGSNTLQKRLLRSILGAEIGSVLFFVLFGLLFNMFRVGTGHDQAYLIMFTVYVLPLLLVLGAVVGAISGACIWSMTRPPRTGMASIKRILIGMTIAVLVGAPVGLYFDEANTTLESSLSLSIIVLIFAATVGLLAGAFAGPSRASGSA